MAEKQKTCDLLYCLFFNQVCKDWQGRESTFYAFAKTIFGFLNGWKFIGLTSSKELKNKNTSLFAKEWAKKKTKISLVTLFS